MFCLSAVLGFVLNSEQGKKFVHAATFGNSTDSVKDTEHKILSRATLEDDFANDRVIVVLNKQESMRFKEYKTTDFVFYGTAPDFILDYTSVYAVINEDLHEKFDAKEFALEDFGVSNVKGISYYHLNSFPLGIRLVEKYILMELEVQGKEQAEQAIGFLNDLEFVTRAGFSWQVRSGQRV